ncbi:hypothetical protein GIB67_014364 [Kingdonia uniflora]|uniref:Disease resistance N-terminal domain-containing protein n=1 Tax=Kingdonia uniflora TaxID=39325 RepID=A0A7J7NTY3_9MAGN|nr:hypothetical protein GIB67_014364 [Kingdonia uniflora]
MSFLQELKKEVGPVVDTILDDAEKQQIKNESVKHWIGEHKDVAYDIDDVLDSDAREFSNRNAFKAVCNVVICSSCMFVELYVHLRVPVREALDRVPIDARADSASRFQC